MATNTERQREYRKRRRAAGLVPVTGFVPAALSGEIMRLMQRLAENRDLELGPVRNVRTGRLERI
jgi:hypothetical protein